MSDYDDPELAAAASAAARSRRSDKRTKLALTALSLMLAAALAAVWLLAQSNARLAEENASFGQQQQTEKKEIAKEARQALCGTGDREIYDRDLCSKWAEAAQEPSATLESAAPAAGPSQADLVEAFRTYCAAGNCRGADGQPPTADDIAAAFVKFCSTGRCTGPAGQPGEAGKDAEPLAPEYEMVLAAVTDVCGTGVCTGPAGRDGANATEEMVLAAVQAVCANDACRGPAGEPGADSTVPGPQGIQGEPGRGIADTNCSPDTGLWEITYTDGAVDADAGRCKPDNGLPPIGGTP